MPCLAIQLLPKGLFLVALALDVDFLALDPAILIAKKFFNAKRLILVALALDPDLLALDLEK